LAFPLQLDIVAAEAINPANLLPLSPRGGLYTWRRAGGDKSQQTFCPYLLVVGLVTGRRAGGDILFR